MDKRVVVTGIGVVSPIGIGKEEFTNNLFSGYNAADRISRFDVTGYRTQIACEVRGFDVKKYIDPKEARGMDLFAQYAYAAAKMAFEDARYPLKERNPDAAIIIGTGIGGIGTVEEQKGKLLTNPRRSKAVSVRLAQKIMPNSPAGYVSKNFHINGRSKAVSTACATSADALVDGIMEIELGDYNVVVAGGAEAAIAPLAISSFANMGAMPSNYNDKPKSASRPFDKDRAGFIMGDGSGIVILELLEHAVERDARIYAEIIGYGCTSDAYDMVKPDPSGLGAQEAMQKSIKMAGLQPRDIDYINAHATSTPEGDPIEVNAIRQVFGEHAKRLAISSTKSMTGHLLGAAGSIEFITCLLAIENKMAPPTINLDNPIDEELNFVPNKSLPLEINVAINNNFGFGGHNTVLVLKRYLD